MNEAAAIAAGYWCDGVEYQTVFVLRALISNVPTISHCSPWSCESFSTFCVGCVPALAFEYISIWIKFTFNTVVVANQQLQSNCISISPAVVYLLYQQTLYEYEVVHIWSLFQLCMFKELQESILAKHKWIICILPLETMPSTHFALIWQIPCVFSKFVTLIQALIEHGFTEVGCSNVLVLLARCLIFSSGFCQFPFFILAMHSLIVSIYLSACYWTFNHFLEHDIWK